MGPFTGDHNLDLMAGHGLLWVLNTNGAGGLVWPQFQSRVVPGHYHLFTPCPPVSPPTHDMPTIFRNGLVYSRNVMTVRIAQAIGMKKVRATAIRAGVVDDMAPVLAMDASVLQQRLFQVAVELVPGLAGSKQHEAWAGLRPGTPDELPILGETSLKGYFVATGHYRDGILLAPITAQVMTDLILVKAPHHNLGSFAPVRFS